MKVRITRLRDDVELPTYKTEGSVAFDFAASEAMTIPAKGDALVPTGLVIACPKGYALIISARSSLYKKKRLRMGNQIGIIDQDFCGPEDELFLHVWNPGDEDIRVEKGERLAQGLFVSIEKAEWDEGPARPQSRGGWGSTGGYGA